MCSFPCMDFLNDLGENRYMKRIKLTVAYDGTAYCGWQVQPNGVTIEEILNREISGLTGEEIRVIGASRTDSGVHALGNVAVFDTKCSIPAERFAYALNRRMPEDIVIVRSEQVPDDWHPRYQDVITKTYEYHICNASVPNPMNTSDTVRTVYDIMIDQNGEDICIRITGNGFLYNMVRIIAGTLIRVGRGFYTPERVKEILEAGERTEAGVTAPPQGLVLVEIRYGNENE